LTSLSYHAAEACWRISNENRNIADEIEIFALPHDPTLKSAYFRFELPKQASFFEQSASLRILSSVKTWLQSASGATMAANVASVLERDNFPATPEDQVALSSLASFLKALVVSGYVHEAELVADAISNFILYEGASGDHGSFRKALIATSFETMAGAVRISHQAYESGDATISSADHQSEAEVLNGLMTFQNDLQAEARPPQELRTPSDFAAGAYFFLTVARSGDRNTLHDTRYQVLFQQLSSAVGMAFEVTQALVDRIQVLLELSSLAALCDAGTLEVLRGCKRLLYNNALIRHLHKTLTTKSLNDISGHVLDPIANALASSLRMNNWSPYRDDAITNLLRSRSASSSDPWSFVNLAVERIRLGEQLGSQDGKSTAALSASEEVLSLNSRLFEARKTNVAMLSVKNGYFGLLRKCLTLEELTDHSSPSDSTPSPGAPEIFKRIFDSNEDTLLHLSARLGFTKITKLIAECLGVTRGKELINCVNAQGQTPLHLACMHRAHREVFTLLWILGANPNVRCNLGRTPLHYCFPDQQLLPSPHEMVLVALAEYTLPTTISMRFPKAFGPYGKGNDIDPRTSDFRVIIRNLVRRGADMTILDHEGMTPLHLAAREGWGDNHEIFLVQTGPTFEQAQEFCLKLRDEAGCTVLDYARMTGNKGQLNGGENIIVAEMRERGMDISPQRKPGLVQAAHLGLGSGGRQAKPMTQSPGPSQSPPQYPNSPSTSSTVGYPQAQSTSRPAMAYRLPSPVRYHPPPVRYHSPPASPPVQVRNPISPPPVQRAYPGTPPNLQYADNHLLPPSSMAVERRKTRRTSNLLKKLMR
jgi:ankyrin repeat protein